MQICQHGIAPPLACLDCAREKSAIISLAEPRRTRYRPHGSLRIYYGPCVPLRTRKEISKSLNKEGLE